MKFECQSCLLQFDKNDLEGDSKCPRCGSTQVKPLGGAGSTPTSDGSPLSAQAAIAPTIAQPMVAPFGAPAPSTASSGPAPFHPVGAVPPAPNPLGTPALQSPFGAPPPVTPNPYGAPSNPYGAVPPAPNPFGAAVSQSPFGAPQAVATPYAPPQGAPVGGAFASPMGGFGSAPMGMVPVTPYGNAQLDAEQRKAMILGVLAILTVWPCAIGAFLQLQASKQAAQMGDFNTAFAKAKSSQMWGWVALGIGMFVLACLIGIAGA